MDSNYFSALIGCICICAVGAYPQYYYMFPPQQAPPASTYYSTSFGGPYEPSAAMSFVSRNFGPSQSYYTTHQTFGNLAPAVPPTGYQTFTGDNNLIQQAEVQQQTGQAAQVPTNTIFSAGATDQYRGFAYHTQLTGGGSANVFFVTGPEAHQLQQLQGFATVSPQNGSQSGTTQNAKTLASNTVDSNAVNKNQKQQIGETLAGPPPGPAFEAIRSFLQNPQAGFQQFYASNGQLFANTDGTNPNIPANTVLLPATASIQAFGNFPFLSTRFNANENTTKNDTTAQKSDDKGEDVAESMNADVRVPPTEATSSPSSQETITEASTASSVTSTEATEGSSSSTTQASEKESTTEAKIKKSRSVTSEATKESPEAQSSTVKDEVSSTPASTTKTTKASSNTTKE